MTEKEPKRRKRTEYAPRQVESSVTEEKFQAYLATRAAALAREAAETERKAQGR